MMPDSYIMLHMMSPSEVMVGEGVVAQWEADHVTLIVDWNGKQLAF